MAQALIDAAKQLAQRTQAAGLLLETEKNNLPGNLLYPKWTSSETKPITFIFEKLLLQLNFNHALGGRSSVFFNRSNAF